MNYDDTMLEVYIYENQQLLEKLESLMLRGEKGSALSHGESMRFSGSCIRSRAHPR
jgi:hypothetical protein